MNLQQYTNTSSSSVLVFGKPLHSIQCVRGRVLSIAWSSVSESSCNACLVRPKAKWIAQIGLIWIMVCTGLLPKVMLPRGYSCEYLADFQ